LKRFLPDTLVGRTVLVLILGLALSQVAALALYSANRSEIARRIGGRQVAARVADVVRLIESTPNPQRGAVLHAIDEPGLRIGWGQMPIMTKAELADPSSQPAQSDDASERTMILGELARRLSGHEIHAVTTEPNSQGPSDELPQKGSGMVYSMLFHAPIPLLRIAVHLHDGSWLNIVTPQRPPETMWRPHFYGPLAIGLLVVIILSVLAVRRAVRPLRMLAAAAERLGRDVSTLPVPEGGTREMRTAAKAFNEMQTRLKRFVDDRTQMIAAISHDLRTPITRLRLRAEFVDDDEQRLKMLNDLEEMEAMITSTLAFARDDAEKERRGPVDLAALLAELAGDLEATYDGPESLYVHAGATSLKRAFTNLIDNARKYAGQSRVILSETEAGVQLVVEDDGPGIPEPEMERVFAPFYRIEASRNRETGGAGLGLPVARSAIRAHGGDVTLSGGAHGGLRVTVTLPR
jgi:signal transduction histidine kinase